jgi:hypothetical protein
MATGKSTTFCNDILKLVLNATAIANIADNAGTSPLTNLYLSLCTASPGAAGDQTTNETSYTSYARQAVARSTSGFTASTAASSALVAACSFPACTGGTETITDAGLGTASSSTGKLLYFGAVSPTISVSSGVTPQLTTSTTVTES